MLGNSKVAHIAIIFVGHQVFQLFFILVENMGTQLEISIGIYTDGVCVDKLLSEDLYLDAWQSDTVLRVCRIFMAVYSVNWTC